jgi:hypothetical protein
MQGWTETILRHLANCPHVDEATRNRAREEKVARNLTKSPTKPTPSHSFIPLTAPGIFQQPMQYHPQLANVATAGPSSSPSFIPMSGPAHTMQPGALFGGLMPSPGPTAPLSSTAPSPMPSPLELHLNQLAFTPLQPSPLQSPSVGSIHGHSAVQSGAKRRRTQHSTVVQSVEWTSAHQACFESRIACITASCGFPFLWVENIEWLDFLDNFLPAAAPISRRVLANRLIPAEIEKYHAAAKENAQGLEGTLQCDGWTGANFHHFLAFMLTTSKRDVHTVRVYDTSTERKMALELLKKIREVKEHVETDWGIILVAVTSDASGESSRARRDLVKEFPSILGPDCYAHQINRVVYDYFAQPSTSILLGYADTATELITWLRSKTFVLGLIRAIQERNVSAKMLAVIRAVLTRWTAHYLAFKRLLELRWVLEQMLRDDRGALESQIIIGTSDAKAKARKMFSIIDDSAFWHNLLRLKKQLEPLALAANITQLSNVRLDQVLIIFGLLYKEYQALLAEDNSFETRYLVQRIIDSIEKRWAKSEQEAFIAALFLNPVYKLGPFADVDFTTLAGILHLLKKLYGRFFGELTVAEDQQMYDELQDYLHDTGRFRGSAALVKNMCASARAQGQHPDPLPMWAGTQHASRPTPLAKLARRLFSVCVNSASCERLFSMFGITLSRLRSRLRPQAMTDLAELRLHLRDEHLKSGRIKERMKRKMTSHHSEVAQDASSQPAVSSTATTTGFDSNNPQAESELPVDNSDADSGLLRHITSSLIRDDEDDGDNDFDHTSRKIADIFNYENSVWTEISKELAIRGLDDELELYELIDLDAAGEDDSNMVDEMTQASLSI